MTTRLKVALCVGSPAREQFFPPKELDRLHQLCDLALVHPRQLQTPEAMRTAISDASVAITSWGFPGLTKDRLDRLPSLRLIAHTGASIKLIVSDGSLWDMGIRVTQAGSAMAVAVAEMSLTMTMSLLRRVQYMDHALRRGQQWEEARGTQARTEIGGCPIGVIGASRTGRQYIRLVRALGAHVQLFDPYVGAGDELAGLVTDLPQLLASSRVLALHAPATPETLGMIGAHELGMLPDYACVVNTSRASLLDMEAFYLEAKSGRLDAALDVYDIEPLPPNDRWRELPNVLLTPHVGGNTYESRLRGGRIVIDEIERFAHGKSLEHEVLPSMLTVMG